MVVRWLQARSASGRKRPTPPNNGNDCLEPPSSAYCSVVQAQACSALPQCIVRVSRGMPGTAWRAIPAA
eukprot:10332076-Alexandrium_andersonii.AAC.1